MGCFFKIFSESFLKTRAANKLLAILTSLTESQFASLRFFNTMMLKVRRLHIQFFLCGVVVGLEEVILESPLCSHSFFCLLISLKAGLEKFS